MIKPYKTGVTLVVEVLDEDNPYYGIWVGEVTDYYQGTRGEMYYSINWILEQRHHDGQNEFEATHVHECSDVRLYCKEPF